MQLTSDLAGVYLQLTLKHSTDFKDFVQGIRRKL